MWQEAQEKKEEGALEKTLMLGGIVGRRGRDCGQEEKGTTKDEMAGWHH